jgi:hypothetical protein
MAYTINELQNLIEELDRECGRLSLNADHASYMKIWSLSSRMTYYRHRIGAILHKAHVAERAALDAPFVPTGNPQVDAIVQIERRHHAAKRAAQETAKKARADVPLGAIPTPHLSHVVTFPAEIDPDEEWARIEALLPEEDRMP